jgi:hypothetical protein
MKVGILRENKLLSLVVVVVFFFFFLFLVLFRNTFFCSSSVFLPFIGVVYHPVHASLRVVRQPMQHTQHDKVEVVPQEESVVGPMADSDEE